MSHFEECKLQENNNSCFIFSPIFGVDRKTQLLFVSQLADHEFRNHLNCFGMEKCRPKFYFPLVSCAKVTISEISVDRLPGQEIQDIRFRHQQIRSDALLNEIWKIWLHQSLIDPMTLYLLYPYTRAFGNSIRFARKKSIFRAEIRKLNAAINWDRRYF